MREHDDELIERVAQSLREPVRMSPALDARVMAEIRAIAAGGASVREAPEADLLVGAPTPRDGLALRRSGGAGRAWRALVQPRPVRVSPLAGLALAAGIAALMVGVDRAGHQAGAAEAAARFAARGTPTQLVAVSDPAAPAGALRAVSFVFVAPGARSVSLAGDFNDWTPEALPLHEASPGVWSAAVPLAPGRYSYSFVVDGTRWEADPAAPRAADDFGSPSSTLVVGPR